MADLGEKLFYQSFIVPDLFLASLDDLLDFLLLQLHEMDVSMKDRNFLLYGLTVFIVLFLPIGKGNLSRLHDIGHLLYG